MHGKDSLSLIQVRQFHMYLTVESTGTKQRLVQNIRPVRGRKDDNATVRTEAIHLRQQLVQGILPFIVAIDIHVPSTGSPDSINLVDEDDTRRLFFRLTEKVADTGSTDSDKHFHEVRTGKREERHICLTRHGLSQECFTGSRRPYKQSSLRNLTSQFGIFVRVLQEGNNLFHFLLCTGQTCHIFEGNLLVVILIKQLRLRAANRKDIARSHARSTGHPAHQIYPNQHQEDKRTEGNNQIQERTVAFLKTYFRIYLAFRNQLVVKIRELVGRRNLHIDIQRLSRSRHLLAAAENFRGPCRLHRRLDRVFLVIHDHLFKDIFLCQALELRPSQLFCRCRAVAHVKRNQHGKDKPVHPIKVEPEHLVGLIPVVVVAIVILRLLPIEQIFVIHREYLRTIQKPES